MTYPERHHVLTLLWQKQQKQSILIQSGLIRLPRQNKGTLKKKTKSFKLCAIKNALWSNNDICEKWHETNYPVFQISGKSFFQTNRITPHKECLRLCCFISQQIQPWKKENRMSSLKKKHNGRGSWGVVLGPLLTSEKFFCSQGVLSRRWSKTWQTSLDQTKFPWICWNLTCIHLREPGLSLCCFQERNSSICYE